MKAALEFQLPDETEEHYAALNGMLYWIVLEELDSYLRGRLKHEELAEVQQELLQQVRDKLHEIAGDRNVRLH